MTESIYSKFIQAKDGSSIPLLKSGRTLESKYNPQKDADIIINSLEENYSFFIVVGIGSGILIKRLFETFSCKIIGVELSNIDINFLKSNQATKEILENPDLLLANKDNLKQIIIDNYIPAKYGNIKILEQKNWLSENIAYKDELYTNIQKAINIIAADFSVQSHFGKIWTCNILNNIKTLTNHSQKIPNSFDISKKALVIGAGPSLDEKINYIKENRNDLFIISTDTAFNSLLKYKIDSDLVVSLDAQNISYNHFINSKAVTNTSFAFDLCGNSSAAKHLIEKGFNSFFFISGHPLSSLFNYFVNNKLITLESGAGTVTLAALDFAIKANFQKIEIIAADFSYSNGKAYTKGSYLDNIYNKDSDKLKSSEKLFDSLLFRTELKEIKNKKYTTQILEAYKFSLIDFLNKKNISYKYENDIYYLKKEIIEKETIKINPINQNIQYIDFLTFLKSLKIEEIETALLPYISWLRNKQKNKNLNYQEFLQLAHSFIVSYN